MVLTTDGETGIENEVVACDGMENEGVACNAKGRACIGSMAMKRTTVSPTLSDLNATFVESAENRGADADNTASKALKTKSAITIILPRPRATESVVTS
jgi:hypothetical protein